MFYNFGLVFLSLKTYIQYMVFAVVLCALFVALVHGIFVGLLENHMIFHSYEHLA